MRIIEDIKYDYSDLLIIPKRSSLTSRKDVDLTREYKFLHSPYTFIGTGIIAANMSHTGTFEMANAMGEYNLCTAIHKHYSEEELIDFFSKDHKGMVFYTIGMVERDYEKFKSVIYNLPDGSIKYLNIDVANGYTQAYVEFVEKVRNEFPNLVIMAGTVTTPEMTEQLILSGADIVRIGIGSGCLSSDTRILMSNGTYKNIKDVKPGDEIITMHGTRAVVKRSFCTGTKKVGKIKTNKFYKDLILTDNHKCYVGDLNGLSETTVSSYGYKKALMTKKAKMRWKQSKDLKNDVAFVPTHIDWNIPDSFDINISEFFIVKKYLDEYKTKLSPSYELGYVFGFYLGDGSNNIQINQTDKGKSTSGRVEWTIFNNDEHLKKKLINAIKVAFGKLPTVNDCNPSVSKVTLYSKQFAHLFDEFNKGKDKNLPLKYWCKDKKYIQGLYDGLMDSDGHYMKDGRHNFTNTSQKIIELFGVLHHLLFGCFPNMSNGKLCSSKLVNAINESYSCRTNLHKDWRIFNNLEIVKIETDFNTNVEIPVYDLEIDDKSHSFIANNMIVHNSVCTTRKVAGVGYPIASAVMECADAAHGLRGHIVSDGGCTMPGDVAKAFGAGADFVMLGGMLAGHDECDGERVYNLDSMESTNEPTHMKFFGMSSKQAMEKFSGGVAEYRASEGKEVLVPYRGKVENTIKQILGGVRSCCTYVGAKTLKELPKRTTFVKVNRTHNTVFGDEK